MENVGGIRVTGGSYPARIWSSFMGPAMSALPIVDFTPPDPNLWPPNDWIGGRPGVLPPGFVLPPHLAAAEAAALAAMAAPPPPGTEPAPGQAPPPATAEPAPTTTSSTTTTKPPKGKRDD